MSNLMCCKVRDSSMWPTIKKGEFVMVDKGGRPLNGEIGVFNFNGADLIKRLKKDREGVFLLSDDGKSKIEVVEGDDLTIIGRMVKKMKVM